MGLANNRTSDCKIKTKDNSYTHPEANESCNFLRFHLLKPGWHIPAAVVLQIY